jgi:hypothetical protein
MVLVVLAILAAAVVFSCGSDKPTAPKITGPNRATPDSLLAVFAKSLKEHNIALYAECLEDSYAFTFHQSDWTAAGVNADKPFWGKSEDVPRTANMFSAPDVKDIVFDWQDPVVDWAACTDSIFVVDHWQTQACSCATYQPDIKITVQHGEEEALTYWVHLSRFVLSVCPDRLDNHLWTVLRMRESLPFIALKGEQSSFGSIKALFR